MARSLPRSFVAWFAAEYMSADGHPADIDRRCESATDRCAGMVAFEPVRDWELFSREYSSSPTPTHAPRTWRSCVPCCWTARSPERYATGPGAR